MGLIFRTRIKKKDKYVPQRRTSISGQEQTTKKSLRKTNRVGCSRRLSWQKQKHRGGNIPETKTQARKGAVKARSSGAWPRASSVEIGPVRTYVDQLVVVSLFQVVQYRGVVQVGQVRHVLGFLILGRVHLAHLFLLKIFHLRSFGRDKRRKDF